jgi:hypothetical protein
MATKRKAGNAPAAVKTPRKELTFDDFPPGVVKPSARLLCLACIFDIFTKQLKLAPRTAYLEVKRHEPSIADLTGAPPGRPYFESEEKHPHCPYCDSSKRWHARLEVFRIEGGKASDKARKALIDKLPKAEGQFLVLEEKLSRQAVLFEWLDSLGKRFDFEQNAWMVEAARAFLEKREPKTDWAAVFAAAHVVRRSQRLEEGWEADGNRLYLSPQLYNEVLLIQYLVSRSHKSGGRTFEGRLTIAELLRRLRNRGYFEAHEIHESDPSDVLEKLVESLDPGSATVRLYYVVDRRDFLEKLKSVYAKYAE